MSREASESSPATRASERAGTITHLAVQPSQPTRVAVFLDGVWACEVSQDVVRAWGLWVGRTLSAEEQTHLAVAEQFMAAQAVATKYLAARSRTAHEVQQKLRRHGVADEIITQVMARLHDCGALDDAAYVHAYLTSRLTSRGYGPQRLRRELHQRGVSRALITEAEQQELAAEDVLTAARVQATKRWPQLAREANHYKRRQKLHDFLRRRGFPAAIVQQVLTEVVQGTT
jgi:regulatory protein